MAAKYAAKKLIWFQHFLGDLGMSKFNPKSVFCNNQGAISLAKNPTHHAKTKHIDVQLQFIWDHVEKGTIKVKYCPTENMLADLMTKGLPLESHKRVLRLMGVGIHCEQSAMPSQVAKIECRHMKITSWREELCNSHGGMPRSRIGASYLCYSNCDVIKVAFYLLQKLINEAMKHSFWNCSLAIAPRLR